MCAAAVACWSVRYTSVPLQYRTRYACILLFKCHACWSIRYMSVPSRQRRSVQHPVPERGGLQRLCVRDGPYAMVGATSTMVKTIPSTSMT
jgi:hypothetical protein